VTIHQSETDNATWSLGAAWDEISDWFENIYRTEYTNPEELLQIERDIETVKEQVYEIDLDVDRSSLTADETAADERLTKTVQRLDGELAAKWRGAALRQTVTANLKRIHSELLGEIRDERTAMSAFEIGRSIGHPDLCGFVESYRLTREPFWSNLEGEWVSMTVVLAPLWVHDIYRHIYPSGPSPQDTAKMYHLGINNIVGNAISATDETLEIAIRLWLSAETGSPYTSFEEAMAAAYAL
jgi:hypothetical protein